MTIDETFGRVADGYRVFRPVYPEALFDFLARLAPARRAAWDVGCGSGQATKPLAARFAAVYATDGSAGQIARAPRLPRVHYAVARAEASGLPDQSVDLVLAAQSAHWFDHAAFAAEVERVARPEAVVALCGYGLMHVTPPVDAVIRHLYSELLGPHWPEERKHIDAGYRTLPFPFAELQPPVFAMEATWTYGQTVGYLATWSAVVRCRDSEGHDPIQRVAERLAAAWGEGAHTVRWPLVMRIGRVGGA